MRSTRNQDASDTERLKNTPMSELRVPKFTTSSFEIFMDNFISAVSRLEDIHGVSMDYPLREVDGN